MVGQVIRSSWAMEVMEAFRIQMLKAGAAGDQEWGLQLAKRLGRSVGFNDLEGLVCSG